MSSGFSANHNPRIANITAANRAHLRRLANLPRIDYLESNTTKNLKKAVELQMARYPRLTCNGIQDYSCRPDFESNRKSLLQCLEQISHVIDWLELVNKRKTINFDCGSSYCLKHWCEKTAPQRYITNGAFIAGALIQGFEVSTRRSNRLNCYFNMSSKSLKELKRLTQEGKI